MGAIFSDLRYAARTLMHSPGYAIATLLSLALGIGANMAIFTLTNAVFLHPLPVREPARILELYTVDHVTRSSAPNLGRTPTSIPNFNDYRERNTAFSSLSGFMPGNVTLTGFGKPIQQPVILSSANYFETLGLAPAKGRFFRPEEDNAPGGNPVAVLSHALAQRLFGSAALAIGRTLDMNSTTYDVIGVAPAGFKGTRTLGPGEVAWLPLSMHSQVFSGIIEQYFNNRRFRLLNAFGRLKPGITQAQGTASLQTIAAALESAYPGDNRGRTVETTTLSEAALGFLPRGQTSAAALALSAAVGFVLLIACANIANLTLVRANKRGKELGIRAALGASRGRIIAQLLSEAELLALLGGILGLGLGWLGARVLWSFRPAFLDENQIPLTIDFRVLAFTAGVAILTGLLFGLTPVLRASTPDLSRILNSGGRGNIQGGGRNRLRSTLVVCEIALALVALAGAGLFIRSMQSAKRMDVGFESRNVCLFSFNLASKHWRPEQGSQFFRSVSERLRSVPGVASVSIAGTQPLGGGFLQTAFHDTDPADSRTGTLVNTVPVFPDYFGVLRIPLVEGRLLNAFDRANSKRVTVVSEAMARALWASQSAIGKRIHFGTDKIMWEVAGVVRNSVVFQIGEPPQPIAYLPFEQSYQPNGWALIRTSISPEKVLPSALATAQALDRDLALLNSGTISQTIAQALWAPQTAAALFGLFGALSTLLAAVGIYGVMAYIVLQRTSEIGVRLALGARAADIWRMVVGQSMTLAGIGIAAGVVSALLLTRLVSSLLYTVSPSDPPTFISVIGALASVALAAAAIPAWRAARVNPVMALREE